MYVHWQLRTTELPEEHEAQDKLHIYSMWRKQIDWKYVTLTVHYLYIKKQHSSTTDLRNCHLEHLEHLKSYIQDKRNTSAASTVS